jgi:NHL repeat-containing protein
MRIHLCLSVAMVGLSLSYIAKCLCPASLVSAAQSAHTSISGESEALQTSINGPRGLAYAKPGFLYIAEVVGGRLLRFNIQRGIVEVIATNPEYANLGKEDVIATDKNGNLFMTNNYGQIKEFSPTAGTMTTLHVESYPPKVMFRSIAVESLGGILGTELNQLMRWTPAGLETVAGIEKLGFFGDGGPARDAGFSELMGVAISAGGDIFIADSENCRIRRIDRETQDISTIAGTGECRSTGDNGPANRAALDRPKSLAIDDQGNLFLIEQGSRVRRIDGHGIISTYVGTGERGFSGDGGLAAAARLDGPSGLAVDDIGNLYIADFEANRIRRVDAITHIITTIAGSGLPRRAEVLE